MGAVLTTFQVIEVFAFTTPVISATVAPEGIGARGATTLTWMRIRAPARMKTRSEATKGESTTAAPGPQRVVIDPETWGESLERSTAA